jgi:hypothetical protein
LHLDLPQAYSAERLPNMGLEFVTGAASILAAAPALALVAVAAALPALVDDSEDVRDIQVLLSVSALSFLVADPRAALTEMLGSLRDGLRSRRGRPATPLERPREAGRLGSALSDW